MLEQLSKFYSRESQADLDAITMVKSGWRVMVTRYSHAARKWEVVYQRPDSLHARCERLAA